MSERYMRGSFARRGERMAIKVEHLKAEIGRCHAALYRSRKRVHHFASMAHLYRSALLALMLAETTEEWDEAYAKAQQLIVNNTDGLNWEAIRVRWLGKHRKTA